jgi:hypothetical protein
MAWSRRKEKITMSKKSGIKAVRMYFSDRAGFDLFLSRTPDGDYRIETFLSAELLAETGTNMVVQEMLKEDFMILLKQGIEEVIEWRTGAS